MWQHVKQGMIKVYYTVYDISDRSLEGLWDLRRLFLTV